MTEQRSTKQIFESMLSRCDSMIKTVGWLINHCDEDGELVDSK